MPYLLWSSPWKFLRVLTSRHEPMPRSLQKASRQTWIPGSGIFMCLCVCVWNDLHTFRLPTANNMIQLDESKNTIYKLIPILFISRYPTRTIERNPQGLTLLSCPQKGTRPFQGPSCWACWDHNYCKLYVITFRSLLCLLLIKFGPTLNEPSV